MSLKQELRQLGLYDEGESAPERLNADDVGAAEAVEPEYVEVDEARPSAPDRVPEQAALFDLPPDWASLWDGMPEYDQEERTAYQTIRVHFRNPRDRAEFARLVDQKIGERTRGVWYPKAEVDSNFRLRRFETPTPVRPRYPIYIVSKGRWDSRQTSRALEEMGVPYSIVVEPQEYEQYAAVIDPAKILTLPFSNLGEGSIPARNWVWEHAIATGAERHWILDDNIKQFDRLWKNTKVQVTSGVLFSLAEEFVDRYENVAMAGFNYAHLLPQRERVPPFLLNTRIYSCILLDNSLPFRWRGRYNEDTDLSLRILKAGLCTVLFNAFLCWKRPTMTMGGGNTDELYQGDGRLKMALSLQEQHPDVVTVGWKWGRPQHQVYYGRFKRNRLIPKRDRRSERVSLEDHYEMSLNILTQYDEPEEPEGVEDPGVGLEAEEEKVG